MKSVIAHKNKITDALVQQVDALWLGLVETRRVLKSQTAILTVGLFSVTTLAKWKCSSQWYQTAAPLRDSYRKFCFYHHRS